MNVTQVRHDTYDVLGIGCVAIDDFWLVPQFPPPDAKMAVDRVERHCGGLTGTALVAAARLGARCAYGGLIGKSDPLSRAVEDDFIAEGIDVSPAVRQTDARPIHSLVIVGTQQKTRNIFFHIGGPAGTADDGVVPEFIQQTRVLFVDQYGLAGAIKAMATASAFGVQCVADVENNEDPLTQSFLDAVNHLILPEDFALHHTRTRDPITAIQRLWSPARQAVVVTCGERGSWWCDLRDGKPGPVSHQPAFDVNVVDTTGCGDVFHGAYAAALAEKRSTASRIKFASAAAALKATRIGGRVGIPTRTELDAFLHDHSVSI